jgi:hypothetical protein
MSGTSPGTAKAEQSASADYYRELVQCAGFSVRYAKSGAFQPRFYGAFREACRPVLEHGLMDNPLN